MSFLKVGRTVVNQLVKCGNRSQTSGCSHGNASSSLIQTRHMSGGHHGAGITYEGLTLHKPARWHVVMGEGFAAAMWFWIFVRAYHDGNEFLFGHAQHFEHEGEDGDGHH